MLILNGKLDLDLLELPRRYKQIRIDSDILLHFLKSDGYIFKIESGLPKDTRIVNARFDETRMHFILILYSESFPDIPKGGVIPEETSIITIGYEQTKEKDEE